MTSSVLQGTKPAPILLNILISAPDSAEHTLSEFADDAKPGGVADTPQGCAASETLTPEELSRQEPREVQR